MAGGDDHRAREVGVALIGRERQQLFAVLAHALERLRLLAETDVGAVLEPLLGAHVDELLAEDLGKARDVVDVLLRIGRGHLAADLLERLDDPHGPVAVAEVVRGGEAHGARPENGHVDDAVRVSHGEKW